MNNADKLLKAIQKRGVTQKPRWKFYARNIVYWIAYGIFLLLGAIAFSVIIFTSTESDFDLLSYYPHSFFLLLLKLLPFFWIMCSVLCIGISLFGFRHTKTGYRYSLSFIVSTSIVGSMVLGAIFFFTGGAEKIEQLLANNVRLYNSIEEKKMAIWSMPEEGFLAGNIVAVGEGLVIEDFAGQQWYIDVTNAFIRSGTVIVVDSPIKIIGNVTEKYKFAAEEIRPWEGRRMQRNLQNRDL